MCGRFTLTNPSDELAGYFNVLVKTQLQPRYNIAPTQPVACVRRQPAEADGAPPGGPPNELVDMRWGLIPYWAKDPAIGNRMINARAETVAEKNAYKDAFRSRRCLVIADGFYEWRKLEGSAKQPYYVSMADRKPFGFAGLWSRWRPREGQLDQIVRPGRPEVPMSADGRVESCSFLTTRPNELMEPIHDRMPVIVPPEHWETWLDPDVEGIDALGEMVLPYPAEEMHAWAVSTHVNRPANDDSECIRPLPKLKIVRPGDKAHADPEPGSNEGAAPNQPSLFD